jgi:hypothetical protein
MIATTADVVHLAGLFEKIEVDVHDEGSAPKAPKTTKRKLFGARVLTTRPPTAESEP